MRSPLLSCGSTRSSDTKARPIPSSEARTVSFRSSTTRGPFTATETDFLPLSNSHLYKPADPCLKLMHRCLSKSCGAFGFGCDLKYEGAPTIAARWSFGHPDGDHVLLNVFAEVYACIEAASNDVKATVISRDVENDVRIVARKLRQLRSEHGRSGNGIQEVFGATYLPSRFRFPLRSLQSPCSGIREWKPTRRTSGCGNASATSAQSHLAFDTFVALDRLAVYLTLVFELYISANHDRSDTCGILSKPPLS